ncbi:MAG: cytochrome C55X NirC [Verminephrobacter sp.]|nr:cytochrome C55X NirC [Verminephrobacter sp.]
MENLHTPPPPPGPPIHALRRWGAALALGLACVGAPAQQGAPDAARQKELVRMVRQDCGSCHGLYLTGGLGPALTREAMADKPLDSMAATIYGGRPGTPMPPWKAMLSEAEALWIAQQLMAGFPEPQKDPR